jgi:hypothetical protein
MSQEAARLRADLRKPVKDCVPRGFRPAYAGGLADMTPLAGLDAFRGIQVHLKRAAMNRSLFGRRRAAETDSLNGIYR